MGEASDKRERWDSVDLWLQGLGKCGGVFIVWKFIKVNWAKHLQFFQSLWYVWDGGDLGRCGCFVTVI
jgi:hypothetical protein